MRQMLTSKSLRALPPDRRAKTGSYMKAAGSFVPRLTAKVFERYGFHSAEILSAWATIAGAELAAVSTPERLKWPRGGSAAPAEDRHGPAATLILRVAPSHALDVEYRGKDIIERINRYFGYKAVAALKVLQAPLTVVAQPAAKAPLTPPAETLDAALAALATSVAQHRKSKT